MDLGSAIFTYAWMRDEQKRSGVRTCVKLSPVKSSYPRLRANSRDRHDDEMTNNEITRHEAATTSAGVSSSCNGYGQRYDQRDTL